MPKNLIILAALALACQAAGAQTVWRCGNSYSQQPCAGGTAVTSSDPRTPSQTATASRVANADARLAAELERTRLAQERNAPKALVIGPQPAASAPQSPVARNGTKPKAGRLEQFTARAPREPAAKPKKHKRKKANA